jgi:predicted transcriptional regulator
MTKKKVLQSKQLLGPLEKDILEILWNNKEGQVRGIFNSLKKRRKVAHTSVAVMLDRLHTKKLVTRKVEACKGGFRYTYYPASGKKEFQKQVLHNAVDSLIERFGDAATTYFNERFGPHSKRRIK